MSEKDIPSFPKIWALGSKEAANIFNGPVEITEKIDGSMFAFGKTAEGKFAVRSKGHQIFQEDIPGQFKPACAFAVSVQDEVLPGFVFYGETLSSPKHNTLAYATVPKNNIALFGVRLPDGSFQNSHESLALAANRFGCGVVPLLYSGEIKEKAEIDALLDRESVLGKEKIEGVVIKNYSQLAVSAFSQECFAKLVREQFKERNHIGWPSKADKMETFFQGFRTEARWHKAIQHLKDRGELEQSPRDIGKLIAEVKRDLAEEEQQFIKDALYRMYGEQVGRVAVQGLPEFYKEELTKKAFEGVA